MQKQQNKNKWKTTRHTKKHENTIYGLDVVVCTCNPSYSGCRGRRIANQGWPMQNFKILPKERTKSKRTRSMSQVTECFPIIHRWSSEAQVKPSGVCKWHLKWESPGKLSWITGHLVDVSCRIYCLQVWRNRHTLGDLVLIIVVWGQNKSGFSSL
jgi:hypothetical protein